MEIIERITQLCNEDCNCDSFHIALTIWKEFSGVPLIKKNYPNRGGPYIIGFSPEYCHLCGDMYNYYGGHDCNIPLHAIFQMSLIIDNELDAKILVGKLVNCMKEYGGGK